MEIGIPKWEKLTKASRKERERELRRNDIIDAAEKLFFSKGYDNVSMSEIAKEADMARATIYQYFKNKKDINAAIAGRGAKILYEMFEKIPEDLTGIENIRALSKTYYQFYKEHTGYYNAYYHSGAFEYEDSPYLEELKKLRKKNFQYVIKAIKKGFKDGTIRKDIDPAATTIIMILISNNVHNILPLTRMYMDEYNMTQDDLFEVNVDQIIRSIEDK